MMFDDTQTLSLWGGRLWPAPKSIPYSVVASAGLPSNDERVVTSIGIIEEKTCLQFRAATNGDTEYIRVTEAAATTCLAHIGRIQGGVTEINIGVQCDTGAVLHEFLHALGFYHEQSRNDRDEFVTVNTGNIDPTKTSNFVLESNAFDIGAYDYNSIMHYSATAFAKTPGLITITSPEPIGQRSTLSDGDVTAIEFLYQKCQAPTAPTCILTKTGNVNIPYNKEFSVSGIGTYSQDLSLSGSLTAVQQASPLFQTYKFTPTQAQVGQTLDINFVYTGADNKATTCSMQVTVLDATEVCYGKGGAEACSGARGTCTANGCQCTGSFGGPTCAAWNDCPYNGASDFDDGTSILSTSAATTSFVTSDSYSGNQALTVGPNAASYSFSGLPRRVSGRVKHSTFGTGGLYLWKDSAICYTLQPSLLTVNSFGITPRRSYRYGTGGGPATNINVYLSDPYKWQLLEVEIVPGVSGGRPTIYEYVDGALIGTSNFENVGCDSGITSSGFHFPNSALVDDFKVSCSQFVSIRGTMLDGTTDQQALLRQGGGTIILFLQGDTWKTDTASLQSVLDSLKGPRDDSQWETHRSSLLSVANVAVSNGDSTLTITLASASNYDSQLDDVISFNPPKSATTDGLGFIESSSFTIRGWCSYAKVFKDTTGFYLGNSQTLYAPTSVKFDLPQGQSQMDWNIADKILVTFRSQAICISGSCGGGPALPSGSNLKVEIVMNRKADSTKTIESVVVNVGGTTYLTYNWPVSLTSTVTDDTYISTATGANVATTQTFICPDISPQIKHKTIAYDDATSTSSGTFTIIPGSIQLDATDSVSIAEDAQCTQKTTYPVRPSKGVFVLTYQGRAKDRDYWLCYDFGVTGTSFVQAFPWTELPPTPVPVPTPAPTPARNVTSSPFSGTSELTVAFQVIGSTVTSVVSSLNSWAQELQTILGSSTLPVCVEIQVLTRQTGETVWVVTGTLDCSGNTIGGRYAMVLEDTSYKPKFRGQSTKSEADIKREVDATGNSLAATAGGTYGGSTIVVTATPTPFVSSSDDDSIMGIGLGVGIGGGVALLIILIVIIWCCCCKKDGEEGKKSSHDPY
eukprot:TRINITY_DN332_c3_g1_i3.p1 TRINITY_DN332_c3_g1~~TRINITY_DN332_c3_g1_i3.p1  ORF type:complete len:1129 (+),score=200.52 TRINITY_DN332_c3_g1_i3:136-3387(+)